MATQSYRSNGLGGGLYDGGTAGIQSTAWTASVLMNCSVSWDEGVDDFY